MSSTSAALARVLSRGSRYNVNQVIALTIPASPVNTNTERQPWLTAIQKSRGDSSAEPMYWPLAYVDVARPRSRCGNQVETTRLLTGNAGASASPTRLGTAFTERLSWLTAVGSSVFFSGDADAQRTTEPDVRATVTVGTFGWRRRRMAADRQGASPDVSRLF